jgi:hypothetical protein
VTSSEVLDAGPDGLTRYDRLTKRSPLRRTWAGFDYARLATADDDRLRLVVFLPVDDATATKLTGLR